MIMKFLRPFFLSLSFLTIIPTPIKNFEKEDFKYSILFFPIIGAILGIIVTALLFIPKYFAFNVLSMPLIVLVVVTIITRSLHLDGFGDFLDAVGSGKSAEEARNIMKDSHLGTFGVVGICIILLAKYIFINSIFLNYKAEELNNTIFLIYAGKFIYVYIFSRISMGILCSIAQPIPGQSGLGNKFSINSINTLVFFIILLFAMTLIPALFVQRFSESAVFMCCLVLIIPFSVKAYALNKIGTVNGDVFGFCVEFTEVILLFVCAELPHAFLN